MSTMLSFLRFRTRRRGRVQHLGGPTGSHLARREPLGPSLGTLVQAPGHSAPTATMVASQPPAPCGPPPTMLARTMPDASLLTPAATVPTVLVPVMRTAGPRAPGRAAPVEGGKTTTLPSRQDAPATTIHPRRTH